MASCSTHFSAGDGDEDADVEVSDVEMEDVGADFDVVEDVETEVEEDGGADADEDVGLDVESDVGIDLITDVVVDVEEDGTADTTPVYHTLSVSIVGTGTVTSTPSGINCGSDCSESYLSGTSVTLSAAAGTGYTFTGWSGGGCTGAGTCVVTVTSATTVTATFTVNRYVLTVSRAGTGSGTVTSTPTGINCGSDCDEAYDHGTSVTLSVSAGTGSTFTGWSGACSGTGSCVVAMTATRNVTATFTLNRYVLTVTLAGSGSGTVTSTPSGINCGSDCNETYDHGTSVTLSAAPTSSSVFSGWSGACSGTGTCVVSMTATRNVTATFEPKVYNIAFISPVAVDGNMGGLSGADSLCGGWAASAGLSGNFRAILSTSSTHASSRLGTARGWIRPDGRPVGDQPSEIFSYSQGPLAPVLIAADGTNMGVKSAWSASNNDGTYHTGHTDCGAWGSSSSSIGARYGFSNTVSEWLDRGTSETCDQSLHIYCFQVDHTTPLDMSDFTETGRIIFVSTGDFNTDGSITAADSLCTADVSTYGGVLAGKTFRAFLADIGASAASRFSSSTTAIVRVDGLRVANNFTALTTGDLIHPPNIKSNGTVETWRVFAGASSPTVDGGVTTTCAGWSSATMGNATEGFASSVSVLSGDRRWFGNTSYACSSHSGNVPVYCLEN